jgi:hypothetical protein
MMAKHTGPPPGYVEVSERIADFRAAHPDGSLQAEIVELRDDLVIVKAYAYRTPDDERPGTGLASEPIPGKTNFTRDSELMNAETSAWGRALIAVGAADAKRGIASANEVRNRRRQPDQAPGPPDLSPLEAAIINAQDAGVAKSPEEWQKLRDYAARSEQNLTAAIGRIGQAMTDAEGVTG